jgi:hypothetical protein
LRTKVKKNDKTEGLGENDDEVSRQPATKIRGLKKSGRRTRSPVGDKKYCYLNLSGLTDQLKGILALLCYPLRSERGRQGNSIRPVPCQFRSRARLSRDLATAHRYVESVLVSSTIQAGHETSWGDAERLPVFNSPSRENRSHGSGQRREPVEGSEE